MKDNSTGKDKEFYELGKKMFDRLNPPLVQREWIETNNSACKILRQVHDMLALASVPPRKKWIRLTNDELNACAEGCQDGLAVRSAIFKAEAFFKEKNT